MLTDPASRFLPSQRSPASCTLRRWDGSDWENCARDGARCGHYLENTGACALCRLGKRPSLDYPELELCSGEDDITFQRQTRKMR